MKKWALKKRKLILFITKNFLWFIVGAGLGWFFLISFTFIIFQKTYEQKVYPGIFVAGIDFGGKKEKDVEAFFAAKNATIGKTTFVFKNEAKELSIKASDIDYGYNATLLGNQAYAIGRSNNLLSNISLFFQAYMNGISLPASYHFSSEKLDNILLPLERELSIEPIDALFTFQDGRVVAFRPSQQGQAIDRQAFEEDLTSRTVRIANATKPEIIILNLPIKVIHPKVTTEKANSLGIKELLASGTSLFQRSIPGRIYNVNLAATRVNGVLVEPGEVFSFAKALGDISAFTGYKQAYVIENGKTVLGDGGGVCQVSTTFFRALLNAGLPIVERHAHAYRVGYYEQDSPPGFDATVYVPSVDLKFKNDTKNYILIQTIINTNEQRLTFMLYGTKDNRQVTISKPVIRSQTPAPPPLYQDDPTLPKGQIKQIDFEAAGAYVSFTREVTKDGKKIIADTFVSNYRPWQAVYLRGTKE